MNKKILRFSCVLSVAIVSTLPTVTLAEIEQNTPTTTNTSQSPITTETDAYHKMHTYPSVQKKFQKAEQLIKQKKLVEGVQWLKQAARQYHPEALFELASYHELGLVVEQDYAKAAEYYERAIMLGFFDARFNLALLMLKPEAGFNDLGKARTLMQEVAEAGDAEAQYALSQMFKDEMGDVTADLNQSTHWLRLAAKAGYAKAQFNLGLQYLNGDEVKQDNTVAFQWFTKAAKQGISGAQFNLALMYDKGEGTEADSKKAIQWYESAIKKGNANAMQNLGIKYLLGEHVARNETKAINLLNQAAEQGQRNAQYLLGRLYHEGRESIKADWEKAERWYLLSAKQGHPDAQYQLAVILAEKKDNPDPQRARFWAEQAASVGHQKAHSLQAKL